MALRDRLGGRFEKRPAAGAGEATAPAPARQLADAEAALNALLAEQAEVQQTLLEHQHQRHEWLRDGGDLQRITDLDRGDYRLRLRSEQIDMQLPPHQAAVQQARAAVHEAKWQDYRPVLVQAQQRLATAITDLYGALTQLHDAHNAAHRAGFADRLGAFIRPPPKEPVSDFALREYLRFAERRQQQQPASAAPLLELLIEAPLHIPALQRFTPRRVPVSEIEAISPIAPTRKVKILHGPVRTAHLQIGIARMFPGETYTVSARATHAHSAHSVPSSSTCTQPWAA